MVAPLPSSVSEQSAQIESATSWLRWAGRLAALCAVLCLGALLDGLIAHRLNPSTAHRLVPGMSLALTGPLPERLEDTSTLWFSSSPPGIQLVFEAVQKEFWFGFPVWRGTLSVPDSLPEGDYRVSIHTAPSLGARDLEPVLHARPSPSSTPMPPPPPLPELLVRVVRDAEMLRRTDPSVCVRWLNLSPWFTAALFLPGILLGTGGVMVLARRRNLALAQRGMAEIHRVIAGEAAGEAAGASGAQLLFGLGLEHGCQVGERVEVLDATGHSIGEAVIEEAVADSAMARVEGDLMVRPGGLVRLKRRGG